MKIKTVCELTGLTDRTIRYYTAAAVIGVSRHLKKLVKLGYTNIIEIGGINSWPGETVTGDK
jgi:hypothetical protein